MLSQRQRRADREFTGAISNDSAPDFYSPLPRTPGSNSGDVMARSIFSMSTIIVLVAPRFIVFDAFGSGLRVEDAVIALVGPFALVRARHLTAIDRAFLMWFAAQVISVFVNGVILGRVELAPAALFALRPLEYWLVGRMAIAAKLPRRTLISALVPMVVVNVAVGVAQVSGLVGTFSKFSPTRGSAFFSGPFDFAVFMAGAYLLLTGWPKIVAAVGLFVSAARITLVAVVIRGVLNWRTKRSRRLSPRTVFTVTSILLLVGVSGIGSDIIDSVASRFQFGIWDSIATSIKSGRAHGAADTAAEYFRYGYVDRPFLASINSNVDPSAVVRFSRWTVLFLSTTSDLERVLFGLGPGWAGVAVDGQFLRVFVEGGLIALLPFGLLCSRLVRCTDTPVHGYAIVLIITALFIDVFVSFKPMALLWVMVATSEAAVRLTSHSNDASVWLSPGEADEN